MKTPKPVRIIQFKNKSGAPLENAARMINIIDKARKDGVGLVIFPDCAIQGIYSGFNVFNSAFVEDCDKAAKNVVAASEGISVLFGAMICNDEDLPYDRIVFAEDGREVSTDEIDDTTSLVSKYSGKFCFVPDFFMIKCEADEPTSEPDAKFIVACHNWSYDRYNLDETHADLSAMANAANRPVFYASSVGIQDQDKHVNIYRGDSAVFDARGRRVALATPFEECALTLSPADCGGKCSMREIPIADEDVGELTEALRYGLREMMAQTGVRRVVIGVSGGIDSAVSTALYGSILKPEDILLVSMPGPFTSATTRGLAHQLAKNVGARFAEIPIGESVELTKRQFAELVTDGPNGAMAGAWSLSSSAVENVQARDRGSRILAAAAAAFGGVVSCNANKDECTVGYGTMYGDITGWLCCLGDLWKQDVYDVGRYLNDKVFRREVIPEGIFKVKPSAELSEKQAVEKGLGDPLVYPYHDALFRAWVEGSASPADTLGWYMNGELREKLYLTDVDVDKLFPTPADFIADLERWWNLYCGLSVAKRLQAPPTLVVSHCPFGTITSSQSGPYYGSRYKELKAKALSPRE
jgi:NAD+ synthase (glutamine-hydrolysing)